MTDNKMTAEQALKDTEIALAFSLAAATHTQCREDVKKAQAALAELRQALSAPRVPEWVATHERLPEHSDPVLGFNPDWIDEDFNAHGIRECFVTGDGTEWVSAKWLDYQDCYETVNGKAPTHWTPYPDIGEVAASPELVAHATERCPECGVIDSHAEGCPEYWIDIPANLRRQTNVEQHAQQVIAATAHDTDELACDTCGAVTDNPWHYSNADNRHMHSCDACWPMINTVPPSDSRSRDLRAEVEALKAKLEIAEKDSDRLDFLEHSHGDGHFQLTQREGIPEFDVEVWYNGKWLIGEGTELREAIDAARLREGGGE